MALATQGFSLRALPQLQRLDPQQFAADPNMIPNAIASLPELFKRLAQIKNDQFNLATDAQTGPDRRALAGLQAESAVANQPTLASLQLAQAQAGIPTANLQGAQAGLDLSSLQQNADMLLSNRALAAENANRTAERDRADLMQQEFTRPTDEQAVALANAERGAKTRTASRTGQPTETRMLTGPDGSTWNIETFTDANGQQQEIARKQTGDAEDKAYNSALRAANLDNIKAQAQLRRTGRSGAANKMQFRHTPITRAGRTIGFSDAVFNPVTGTYKITRTDPDGKPLMINGVPIPVVTSADPDGNEMVADGTVIPDASVPPADFKPLDTGSDTNNPLAGLLGSATPAATSSRPSIIPTLTPEQALSPQTPPGPFLGVDGKPYMKGADGRVTKAQ